LWGSLKVSEVLLAVPGGDIVVPECGEYRRGFQQLSVRGEEVRLVRAVSTIRVDHVTGKEYESRLHALQ
jgi:hypothetical protein